MSHSSGRPFMFETMLRSGVPPHIGQSPDPPGSDALVVAPAITSATTRSGLPRKHETTERRSCTMDTLNAGLKSCATSCGQSAFFLPLQKLTPSRTPNVRGAPVSPTKPDGASPGYGNAIGM